MEKHVYGTGSWSKQVKGGKEYHRLTASIEGVKKDFYGKTKAEAQRKYKDFLQGHTTDVVKKTTLTLCEVAKEAIESHKGQVKESTYDFYMYGLKRLSKENIGAFQIHSVTFSDLQAYINSMVDIDSMSTIKRQYIVLGLTFEYALNKGWVKTDETEKIKLPNEANISKEKRDPVFLTTDERKELEKACWSYKGTMAMAAVFILHTGLRIGELIALWWEDVDMKRKFIHVRRNVTSNGKNLTTPKRKASIRKIPLDDTAFEIIEKLSEDKNGDFVFHASSGNMLDRHNTYRTLDKVLARTTITKQPCLHDLRHTFASELIRNGADMKTVSVVLGHKDIATTMNIYVHKDENDLNVIRNLLK